MIDLPITFTKEKWSQTKTKVIIHYHRFLPNQVNKYIEVTAKPQLDAIKYHPATVREVTMALSKSA